MLYFRRNKLYFQNAFDLYYYMPKILVDNKVNTIDFGQTSEDTKCKLGCGIEERDVAVFSGNRFIT